jgi:DNA-binding PadR family transcriptional regulator
MTKPLSSLTDAELALLSLLAESPMHGYQIEQIIEERGMRDWTQIGFSSIYYLLDKMKGKGWLTSSLAQGSGKGPARQVYQITPTGQQTWKTAVLDALRNPHKTYSNFMIGLANIIALAPGEVQAAVGQYHAQLTERRAQVQAKLDSYNRQIPWEVVQLFDLSLAQIDCELAWTAKFLQELQERNKDKS